MKLLSSETAASEVIGHILILFITILGISMIALYGVPAIYSLEDTANSKNSEQAFTVLDSRASRLTLGDSPLQVTNINLGGGTVTVEPNSSRNPSYMVINSSNFNIVIPMGRVKYILGDRIVAYEGGGVWAQYPGGNTVMLSPPEFHFNGVTLTLPLISINGSSSVGGKGTATISFKKNSTNSTIVRYPNASANMKNPVNSTADKIYVNITSDFYEGWAAYMTNSLYTTVSKNPASKTVRVELIVKPPMGTFPIGPIDVRNLDTTNLTPLNNFSLNLVTTNKEVEEGIEIKNGSSEFKIDIHREGNGDIKFDLEFIGHPDEKWEYSYHDNSDILNINLLNGSMNFTYNGDCTSTWSPQVCPSANKSLYDIMQHYMVLLGTDSTITEDEHGDHIDYSKSTYTLDYDVGPVALTYLHITENRADVGIS